MRLYSFRKDVDAGVVALEGVQPGEVRFDCIVLLDEGGYGFSVRSTSSTDPTTRPTGMDPGSALMITQSSGSSASLRNYAPSPAMSAAFLRSTSAS